LQELLALYLTDTSQRLGELRTALTRKEVRAAEGLAHSLKGSSNNVGVRGMAALCLQLEGQLADEAVNAATRTMAQLEEEFSRVQEAIEGPLQPV